MTRLFPAHVRLWGWLLLGCWLCATVSACRGCTERNEENELVVFAAASLQDAFETLVLEYESAHPEVDVTLSTAGSQALRVQIEQGAPADVFASANPDHVDALVAAGLAGETTLFARNRLVLIVPRENPTGLRSIEDLPRAKRIVIGTQTVPVGKYTRAFLERAGRRYGDDYRKSVEARVVSEELNVRLVATKVALGEADAGIVYETDARAFADQVTILDIPDDVNVIGEYHQAILARTPHPELAQAWIELVLSPVGQRTLRELGFQPAQPKE